jgi:hypothetical protein
MIDITSGDLGITLLLIKSLVAGRQQSTSVAQVHGRSSSLCLKLICH